jgi:CBS-domain-containing membrane protein
MSEAIAGIMHTQYLTLEADTPIRQAAGLLHANGEEAAPVVDAAGALVGLLSSGHDGQLLSAMARNGRRANEPSRSHHRCND